MAHVDDLDQVTSVELSTIFCVLRPRKPCQLKVKTNRETKSGYLVEVPTVQKLSKDFIISVCSATKFSSSPSTYLHQPP